MTTLSDVIRALHENARQQTTVAFDTRLSESERRSATRRLRREERALERERVALRAPTCDRCPAPATTQIEDVKLCDACMAAATARLTDALRRSS